MTEQWMSIVEYARACNISDMTVRRRIKTGRLAAKLIDNKYYIPVSAIEAESEGRRTEAIPSAPIAPPRAAPLVIKAHPSAQKTLSPPQTTNRRMPAAFQAAAMEAQPRADEVFGSASRPVDEHECGQIPSSLTRNLNGREAAVVETKALLAFCEASLRKAAEAERRTVEKFKAKLETAEAVIASKDLEIKALRQEVEDLQMLVRYLDPAKASTHRRS